jgi:integrase
VFRKACATILDENELSAREIADQLGHVKVSMTQDNYLGRRLTSPRTAEALQLAVGSVATHR